MTQKELELWKEIYGFDSYKKIDTKYNGMDTYHIWNREDEGLTVGPPRYLLINGGVPILFVDSNLEIE